jgi:DNA-binding beta-propeller fold protein YncE
MIRLFLIVSCCVSAQIKLDTFPMATVSAKDGKTVLVLNGGSNPPSISVVDIASQRETSRTPVSDGWLGLALTKDEKTLYAGGGSQAAIFEFTFAGGKLTPGRTFAVTSPAERKAEDFIGDVQLSPDGRLIYATDVFRDRIVVVNPQSGRVIERFATGRRPYRIQFHPDGRSFFVTSWADGSIYHHRATDGERLAAIRLGPHLTDLLISAKPPKAEEPTEEDADKKPAAQGAKQRLFVTASNTNNVYVVGLTEVQEMRLIDTINVAMTPRQPVGMTPSALALSADERTLFVACSDANLVAVVDVEESKSKLQGFMQTGRYPTGLRSLPDQRLLVVNGADNNSTILPVMDGAALAESTRRAIDASPYRDEMLQPPLGERSSIEHVVYILKENRTYDQILGDIGKGNSDPALSRFPEKTTPNHHALAREFVLLDNFRVASASAGEGLNWSAAAIAPDYVRRLAPNSDAGRRKKNDYEAGDPASLPPAGYLWSNALVAGVSVRNYGVWVENRPQRNSADGIWVQRAKDPSLTRVTNLRYPGANPAIPDTDRARIFLEDLAEFEKTGSLPRLLLIRLANDGTPEGVADNDRALGMIVEGISKSKFWPKAAVFAVETSAGLVGSDHVDPHRSIALVASPFVRRGIVDSNAYTQASVLRTIELILGLRPMTTFDAAAKPLTPVFSNQADLKPFLKRE